MSEQDEDFAAMFEASLNTARQFSRGQQVDGTIVSIGPKVAFVNIGGKGEAEIDVAELKDDEGDIEVSTGDRITAIVVSTSGGITLSRKGVRHAATYREIEDAYRSGIAIEGKVAQSVKGGYEVRVARAASTGSGSSRGQSGSARAFCPLSQIDVVRTEDPEVHVGRTYAFHIIEYKNGGKDIVLSRRRLLEQQQLAEADEMRKSIVAGAVLSGRVVSVPDFGAFVDLGGGIQGLLHVSEMSWTRIPSPNAVVAVGDQITVRVLRVDEATGRISLGLKQLQDDPWSAAASRITAGQLRQGRVARVADFGVFVEIEPGIEALMPASETGIDRGMDLRKAFPAGSEVDVVVLDVDAAAKRIRVSKKAVAEQRERAEVDEYRSKQEGASSPSIGSLADKLRGALSGDR